MAHPRLRLRTSNNNNTSICKAHNVSIRAESEAPRAESEAPNCSLLLIYLPRKDERLSWPGWLAVTLRYCIKTAKPIGKLFRPSESPNHSSFLRPLRRYKIPRGTPSAGALNTRVGGKNWRFSFDFWRTSPFISETVRDRPMVTMER